VRDHTREFLLGEKTLPGIPYFAQMPDIGSAGKSATTHSKIEGLPEHLQGTVDASRPVLLGKSFFDVRVNLLRRHG